MITMEQQEMELPAYQQKKGALTKAEEERACRYDLQ